MVDIEDIKNLKPEERIRALKDMEEKKKREIAEAKEIITHTEKELQRDRRDSENIERLLRNAPKQGLDAQAHKEFQNQLAQVPAKQLAEHMENLYTRKNPDNLTYEERSQLIDLSYAFQQKEQAVEEGTYIPSSSQALGDTFDTAKKMVNQLLGSYR